MHSNPAVMSNRGTAKQRKDTENLKKTLQAITEEPQTKRELQRKFCKKQTVY